MNLNKKEEGKLNQIPNTEQVVIKVDKEVPKKLNKIEKDDKQSFEDFKNLYKGVIDMKCNQDYGTKEDKDLWEDCAKELFLKSKNYILLGDEYKAEPIQKKTENKKIESAEEYNTIPEIKERLKEINKQLAYIRRRDAVSLSIGTEEEQEELYSERAKLNGKLRKLRNDAVNMDKLNPSDQAKLKDRLKDLHLWDGKDDTLQSALQSYRNHYIQQFEDKKIDHNIDSYKAGDIVDILGSYGKWLNSSDRIKYVIDRPATKEEIEGIWDIDTPCYIVKTIGMTDDTKFLNGTSKEPITRLRHAIYKSKEHKMNEATIDDKAPILEALVDFLNDNNVTADNIDKNKDLVEKYLSDNKLGISAYIPTIYKVAKDDYGTIGRIIFYRSKNEWGFNTSSIVIESNKINESFDLDLIEKNIKGKRLSDAARYLGALVNGDRNSFEIQGSELISKLNNKDKVRCVIEDNDIIKSIVKDFTHLTDKTESLNKTCKNESYYIKLFNKDNTDIDTIEASTEQEAIKTAEEKMKEGWRAVVYNADNKEALYDYDPFEELEESLQEEEITPANIKEKALEILPKEDVDVKDSDLYIKVSDKSKELINKLQFKNNGLLTTFRSPIDNEMWYDIPFANLDDYITSKTESNNNTYYYDIHIVEDEATGMGYSVFIKTTKHYDEDLDADAIVDEAIKQNKLDADEADYCDYVSEISEQEYKDAVPHTENELVKVGDKFINQNGAMITILEPTKNNEIQFKVTNTKTGEEGTDVYITSSIDKILKDNGYTKIEERINNYDYIIYRPRLTKSPIYVKNYSTETEDKNEAITFPTKSEAEEYRDNLELSYKEQYKIGVKNLDENKEIKTESRDRVAENLPKFIYDLTKKDFDDFGETAWSAKEPARGKEGLVIYEVFKNGKSNYTSDYVVKEILKTFPELKLGTKSDINALFIKFNKVEESTEREYIATYKMPNGTFFELYKNDDKLVDQNGNEISEDELNNYEKIEENKLQENNTDLEYKYMLLDRLKQDCEYFLGNGNGNVEHSLWAKDIDEQIEKMKEIYNSFSEEEKPDWITLEDINNYEKRMKAYNKDVKTEDLSDKDKFLIHLLNGVIKDIQDKFNVEATAEFTKDEDEIVIYIRGNTLDLIDATSYLAKTIRRDDVNFEFDENIIDNTIKCYIAPKNLDESKVEESIVSDYTLSEIKKVIDSTGDDFNLKISNADIDVETKTLSIDREDLISIYNTLGGNKDSITESRPDKDRARAAAFAGSRRRLQLPANGLNEEAEIIEYLEKCKNQIDIMNVNEAIKNTELRNKLLTTGFDFAKSVNIVDDQIDEFKNVMIKATQDYFQNIKTESKKDSDLKSQYYDFLKQEIKKYCKNGTCKIKADKANTGYPEDNLYISIKEDVEKIADEKLKQYILSEIEENDFWGDMYVCGYKDTKTESKEGYQDKCCMCGTSNLNGCYSVLDEEGNVGSVCVDCGKKYSLPEIEKKINSDMKSESKVNLKEDQYEYNRRKGRPNVKKIAEDEYYDNQDYYDKNIHKYEDMEDFIYQEIADIAYEYNLKEKPAKEVCQLVYLMATKKI